MEASPGFPFSRTLFRPTQPRLHLDRKQRSLVAPCLEPLIFFVCNFVEQIRTIGAQSRKERHILSAYDDWNGIQLQQLKSAHGLAKMTPIDTATRSRLGEALSGERDPARLAERNLLRHTRARLAGPQMPTRSRILRCRRPGSSPVWYPLPSSRRPGRLAAIQDR
jgi:hypothetical protein